VTRSVRVVLTGARPIVRQGLAGVLAEESAALLADFFAAQRDD